MSSKLKQSPQIWKLAHDLGLKPKYDALAEIVELCIKRVGSFFDEFNPTTLSDLLGVVAAKLDTHFIEIHDDSELEKVKGEFLERGEVSFANLEDQLSPEVFAITFRLLARRRDDRQFVSIIDCRGEKAWRSYFSKWHELAHLLTLTPQMRLKFCRTHCVADQKDPEEAAMDVIAGTVGFFSGLVARYSTGEISFERIRELRTALCPEASVQASLIGFTKSWRAPVLLIQVGLGLRKREKANISQASFGFREMPQPVLRALNITSNDAARETSLQIHRNMRVPKDSVIRRVWSEGADHLRAIENLSSWQASDGTSLPDRAVHVEAQRFGIDIYALVTLGDFR